LRYTEGALGWVELPPEFAEVGDELVVVSSLDDHIIHISFNIAM
jgi:hypothetical protein